MINESNKLINTFNIVFIFFITSGYIIRPTPTWAIVFYVVLLPMTLIIMSNKKSLYELLKNKSFITASSMIIWFALTMIWGKNQDTHNILKYSHRSFANFIFLFTAVFFFSSSNQKWVERLLRILPFIVILNIFISIVVFYFYYDHPIEARLRGWAETRHSILGSLVIASGFCISFYQARIETDTFKKAFYIVTCIACCVFVVLTQSRGPMLTFLSICIVYGWLSGKTVRWTLLVLATIPVIAFLTNDAIQSHVLSFVSRSSWRFEIWQDAWKYIQDAPILGNGLATKNVFGSIEQKFPHSLYVSSAFYGGFIGLALFLLLFAQLAWTVLKIEDKDKKALYLSLLCVPCVGGLTDMAQIAKSPGELWYILWLPVTAIIGYSIHQARQVHIGRPKQPDYLAES